jgi:hypothetical protein
VLKLRELREQEREDAPRHFEGVPLRSGVRGLVWLIGGALAGSGVLLIIMTSGSDLEPLASAMTCVGGLALLTVARCRRAETVLGKRWLKIKTGPFAKRIAIDLITTISARPATRWRRLYCDNEVALDLGTGEQIALPSRNPEEMIAEITAVRGTPDV